MILKVLLAATALTVLSACTTLPAEKKQMPEFGILASAGIGEPVYRYEYKAEKLKDDWNGTITYTTNLNDFTQEVLYSGVSKGELKFVYREFVGDLARPAFTQEAQYEFTTGSTVVSFKGAIIHVANANNRKIQYMVERGFSNEK